MNRNPKDALRDSQLAFMGKLLAGVSHEFKNHLAVIKELSGLMGDLLALDASGSGRHQKRFEEIIATLSGRASQAAMRAGHLNRFAHRLDSPCSSFAVNEVLEEMFSLLNWYARQKDIRLELSFADDLPVIYNNPSLAQWMLFHLVSSCFELFEAKSRVMVSTAQQGSSIIIDLCCEGHKKAGADPGCLLYGTEVFRLAMAELQAEALSLATTNNTIRATILIGSVSPSHSTPA